MNFKSLIKLINNKDCGQNVFVKHLKVYIGAPHHISNIRKLKIEKEENESKYEIEYRLASEQLNEWNHQ